MYIPGLYHTYTKIPKVVHGGCFPDGGARGRPRGREPGPRACPSRFASTGGAWEGQENLNALVNIHVLGERRVHGK